MLKPQQYIQTPIPSDLTAKVHPIAQKKPGAQSAEHLATCISPFGRNGKSEHTYPIIPYELTLVNGTSKGYYNSCRAKLLDHDQGKQPSIVESDIWRAVTRTL